MVRTRIGRCLLLLPVVVAWLGPIARGGEERSLSLVWSNEMLTIRGSHLPGGELPVWYMEAFCRPGSSGRDWKETVIPHETRVVETSAEGRLIRLRSELDDGVVVDHEIRAGDKRIQYPVGVSCSAGRSITITDERWDADTTSADGIGEAARMDADGNAHGRCVAGPRPE